MVHRFLPVTNCTEYILFRGSDIKDLQVKFSIAAQTLPPVNSDPAIIQSQHTYPAPVSKSLSTNVVSTSADTSLQTSQLGLPRSNVQNGAPLYQPGGSVGSWGPSAPSANGGGISMPMYWQGYYAPPNGLPSHQYQQPLMQPPGLSMPPLLPQQMPPLQQQLASSLMPQQTPSSFQHPMQYPRYSVPLPLGNSSLPAVPLLFPPGSITGISTSVSLSPAVPSSFPPALPLLPVTSLTLDAVSSSIPIKAPIAAPLPGNKTPVTSLSPTSSILSPILDGNTLLQPLSGKPITTSTSPAPQQSVIVPQSVPTSVGAASLISNQAPAPALLTAGDLLKPSSSSSVPSSETVHKDVEVVQVSSSAAPEPPAPADSEVKPPILQLPLPTPSRPIHKVPSESQYHAHCVS